MSDASLTTPVTIWADVQPEASRRLLLAALESFATRGFHATTTRDIAKAANMSPAAVYVHYSSKAELLFEISRTGHESVLATLQEAVAQGADPIDRLRRFVAAFAAWAARHHTLARVIQYALDALAPGRRSEVMALRRPVERLVERVLRDGAAAGTLAVDDVPGTAIAVLSLCADVARWYDPARGREPEAIGALYADLVERMVRAPRVG